MSLFKKLFSADEGRFTSESYDPGQVYPAVRASICTGEKVAGFRSKTDGHFIEVMLIRSKKDEEEFKQRYHIEEDLKVEY
jgi:hypothetical protein